MIPDFDVTVVAFNCFAKWTRLLVCIFSGKFFAKSFSKEKFALFKDVFEYFLFLGSSLGKILLFLPFFVVVFSVGDILF